MFEIWLRAITRPMLTTYQELLEEEPNPSLGTALLWMIVAGAISAVVSGILSFITGFGGVVNEYPPTFSCSALILRR